MLVKFHHFLTLFLILEFGWISLAAKLRDRNTKPYRLVCYYGAWANWRKGAGKMIPADFDTQLCTHLVYGFAVMKDNKITSHDPYMDLEEDWGLGFYKKFNDLRKQNKGLTTLLAVGGWNEGNPEEELKYSKMASDPAKRKIFVTSVIDFLKKYDFDGLDFDWEYPALRDGVNVPEDRQNFVTILKELKEAFEPYGFVLTAAVAAGKHTIEAGYDIPQVSKYLDIINIMAYDFHGAWDNYTGHNSPLYARPDEDGRDTFFNADYAITHWIDGGADKGKITLGMPLYGRCYTLEDKKHTGYGALRIGNGTNGIYTDLPGMQGYHELCLGDCKKNWTSVWNEHHLAPYMYKDDQWCSYDDTESLRIKVEYLKVKGLSGAMIWSIDTDDFRGACFGTKFPLIKAIIKELKNPKVPELPKPHTPSPWPSTKYTNCETSTVTPVGPSCISNGLFPVIGDCTKFLHCYRDGAGFVGAVKQCPERLVFNAKRKICDYASNVPGCQ